MADAKSGLAMASSDLRQHEIAGQTYWCAPTSAPTPVPHQSVFLLPNYDEYIVGYADRSAIFNSVHTEHLGARGSVLFNHTIVLDGQVIGTWKRTLSKEGIQVTPAFFRPPNEAEMRACLVAASRYGAFLGLPGQCRPIRPS